jgi:hypothetical protein
MQLAFTIRAHGYARPWAALTDPHSQCFSAGDKVTLHIASTRFVYPEATHYCIETGFHVRSSTESLNIGIPNTNGRHPRAKSPARRDRDCIEAYEAGTWADRNSYRCCVVMHADSVIFLLGP